MTSINSEIVSEKSRKCRESNPGPLGDKLEHNQLCCAVPIAGLTLVEDSDSVIEGHGLDVERSEDGLLVRQGRVVVGGHLGREDDAHITKVDVDGSKVGTTQRRTLHEGQREYR